MKKTVTTNIKTAFFLLTFLSAWVVSGGCWADGADTCGTSVSHARQLSYEYIASYPHDTTAFTQGLVMHGGYLYESTGQLGTSTLRKLEIKTGTILKQYYIGKKYFAEGLTVSGDSLVHLTWKYGRAFIYDINSFKPSGNFDYEGEGWGIVAMKDGLLVSDGSATLKVLNRSGQLLRAISVHDDGQPVEGLNEMEIVGDMLFANVWPTNCIAAINPSSG
jgi:glutamine cyclotransferase